MSGSGNPAFNTLRLLDKVTCRPPVLWSPSGHVQLPASPQLAPVIPIPLLHTKHDTYTTNEKRRYGFIAVTFLRGFYFV